MQINTHSVSVCLSGILYGTMTLELGGQVSITCEKTGYSAQLEFKLKVCVCVCSCQCVLLFKLLWHLEEQWGADRKATDITSVTYQTNCHTDNGTTSTNEWCSVWLVSIAWLIFFFHHSRSLAAVIVSIRSAGRSNLGRRCWRHSRGTGWVCVLI